MKNEDNLNPSFSRYLTELMSNKSVLGVALTGSFGRNDNDKYSDIDFVVFIDSKSNNIREGKFIYDNLLFDSRVEELNLLKDSNWSQDDYFAYLGCRLVYDKDGVVKKIFNKKKELWKKNLSREISLTLVKLSVIFNFSDNWRGLMADSHYIKFIKREDFISAHRILNLGFELILDLLYLLCEKPIPDIKNKTKLLSCLNWKPKGVNLFLEDSVLILEKSERDCDRRYQSMKDCIRDIKRYIDKNIILAENLYQYYLSNR
jgi:hypothetical protein